MIVEVCANSYESANNAALAGADRIELCSELAVGGITPSYGLIKKVINEIAIPINVLIRPRSGDFTYSSTEFDVIKRDILACKKLGCQGIVTGVLNNDNTLDIDRIKILIELSRPLSFTFHRAFDWVENPVKAIIELANMGVDRVLTSGGEKEAIEGITLLNQLQNYVKDRLIILPGGGINRSNILAFKNAGLKEVHFSATETHRTIDRPKVQMNSVRFFDETQLAISDPVKLKEMIRLVK